MPTSEDETNDSVTAEGAVAGPGPKVTVEQAYESIHTLIDAFDALTNGGTLNVQAEHEQVFTDVFGWWVWINNSSKLVLLAHEAGRGHEASPNVRTILEHALVMQWVIDDTQAATAATAAIAAKAAENRRKLFDEATAQNWTIPDGITRPEPTRQTMLDFASLCARYDAKILYIPYRILSNFVHPSAKSAEAHLDHDTLELRNHADKSDQPNLTLVAICLLQAAQAIDALTSDRPLAAAITAANAPFKHSIEPFTHR